MEYTWKKDNLESLKQQYIFLKNHSKDLTKEEKKNIQEDITKLNQMIYFLQNQEWNEPKTKEKYLHSFLKKEAYQEYSSITQSIRRTCLLSMCFLKEINFPKERMNLPKIDIPNTELVQISKDFYKWLPLNFQEKIDKYTNPKKHLLYFKKDNSQKEILGYSYFFYYPKYTPYIYISKRNTHEDILTLNHELGHTIYFEKDNYSTLNSKHYYLQELEGSFFDLLSILFLKEKNIIGEETANILEYNYYMSNIINVHNFFLIYTTILLYSKKNFTFENIRQKYLEWDIKKDITKTDILENTKESPEILAKYIFSFFTSIDLYEKFLIDREKAFLHFQEIRENKTDFIERNLEKNNVTFMSDNYTNLRKNIKKLHLTNEM